LNSDLQVLGIITEEMQEIKKKYGDKRRSEIIGAMEDLSIEDLIQEEDMVVTVSQKGYVKRLPVSTYRAQRRGGRGVSGASIKEDDFVEHLFIASTHAYLLVFTNQGRVYWIKVYEIPEAGRTSRGKAMINLIRFQPEETIEAIIPVKEFSEELYLLMATSHGVIKRTRLDAYSNPRSGGIIAITLDEKDALIQVQICRPEDEVVLATRHGKAIRFKAAAIREVGRTGRGVRGISLTSNDNVVGMQVAAQDANLLTITTKGFGKSTSLQAYRTQSRGGLGMINIKTTERNGEVVTIKAVHPRDELMLITNTGTLIRIALQELKAVGRNAQGVRMIKLGEQESVSAVAHIDNSLDEE
jgi:DNA gyrase subunit A